MPAIKIAHYSDILCIWAYVGQNRLNRLASDFGDRISIDIHFCSVFPDTHSKIETNWKDRGGFEGYAHHVQGVAAKYRDVPVHADTWTRTRPRSSASPHLFVRALELLEQEDLQGAPTPPYFDRMPIRAAQALRVAFFAQARDVAHWDVQRSIAGDIGVDFDRVTDKIKTGEAIAKLAADYDASQALKIEGSPTYVLNEGRQKLFGNVSVGVIAANINELLNSETGDVASLCS
jgi:predicted DsbA family dithiol-disulfide isomerase